MVGVPGPDGNNSAVSECRVPGFTVHGIGGRAGPAAASKVPFQGPDPNCGCRLSGPPERQGGQG